ncbi:MAG TPA: ABC transporter ATP-binding protein [Balneolales bacterium]|nr:ABC transporter ATP-binding protein [Balneolales bacterium]
MGNPILEVDQLTQSFISGDHNLTVLNSITFSVERGTTCAIVGPSGSGKTTLLGLCAGLDRPTSGNVSLNGVSLNELDEDERAEIRNQYVGFVFQNFQLVTTLTALENVMVPMELRGKKDVRQAAVDLLDQVGLSDRAHHYPSQLSGGEQQRVSLARAFINRPELLFADEPTGNLDNETSHIIEDLLFEMNRVHGATLLLVTHNLDLAGKCDRLIRLRDGAIYSDTEASEIATGGTSD